MNRIVTLIFLMLFSGHAVAGGIYQEVCYTEPNVCMKIVDYNGFLSQIIIKKDVYNSINPELVKEFGKAGARVTFQVVTDARYNALAAPTIYRSSAAADADLIDGLSDEEFDVTMNTLSCLGAAVGCASGIVGSVSTGGVALFFAGMSCGLAPVSCLQARRSYIKWRRWQERVIEESKIKDAASREAASGGRGGGEGGSASEASPGGFEKPLIDDGRPGRTGTVTGSEDGSSGAPLGRRIWQN